MRLASLLPGVIRQMSASESHKAHYVRPYVYVCKAALYTASESHKAHYVRLDVAEVGQRLAAASESHKAHYVRPRDSYLL